MNGMTWERWWRGLLDIAEAAGMAESDLLPVDGWDCYYESGMSPAQAFAAKYPEHGA